jgi:hypothetical protein
MASPDMPRTEDLIREHKRLSQESARFRADSIRTRILAVHAFCSVAESKLRWASPADAEDILATIRARVSEIDYHLREPEHIPAASVAALRILQAELEARIRRIEKAMQADH